MSKITDKQVPEQIISVHWSFFRNNRRLREVLYRDRDCQMTRPKSFIPSYVVAALLISFGVIAQQTATEAPAGFATPALSLSPTVQGVSNGATEPAGDTFALDQAQFERRHDSSTGLGPLFNATSCAECHQNGVIGTGSQFTESRAGHRDAGGNFVNPAITINGGQSSITGRSIVNDRAICEQAQEHLPISPSSSGQRWRLRVIPSWPRLPMLKPGKRFLAR